MDSTSPNAPPPSGNGIEDEQIDLRAYAEILLKRKWVVLTVFLAAVGATSVYTMRLPKIYSASASLVIDATTPQVLGEGVRDAVEVGSGSYWYSKEFYLTQHRIIRSRAVAQRVVDQLQLGRDPAFLGLEKLEPEKQREAMERIDPVKVLQSRTFVEPVKDSRIVNVRVEDRDPERAALLANAIAEAYKASNLERRIDGNQEASEWLQDQLVDLKNKLTESELALYSFKKENDLLYASFENKQTITAQKLLAISDTLTKVRTRKAEIDARVKQVRAARDSNDLQKQMELGIVASNRFIADLKLKYVDVQNEVNDLVERYGPEHPKMVAAQEKLKSARETLQREVDAIVVAALAESEEIAETERNLVALLEETKREAFENNKKEMDYKRLAREEENNQRLYDLVLKRMKELDLSGMLKTNNVRVLDPAQVSRVPVKPNVRRNIGLAALLGLFAGVGLAMLLEYQDRTVKGHADVEALGLNFLGLIPAIPGGEPNRPVERDLYVMRQPKSTVAECTRTIRTNLLFLGPDKPIKTLVVTSAAPQEGKSTTLINVGMSFAQSGNKVLLIDSDMRRPRLHKSFGVSNEIGLSTLIVGEGSLEDAIKSTEVPGLYVLPSGPVPPNPAELLHTENFRKLTAELSDRFDRLLFDTPPVGAVTDPLVLANQMDGTLLVLKMLRTDRALAEQAVKSLRDVNAKVLGAVLNDVDLEKKQYGYYLGYYYGYGQYYGEGKGRA